MSAPTVYVICDNNCKYEGMTKEQILTAIMQAVNSGEVTNIDAGFITTIKTINNIPLKFFYGTQNQHNALSDEQKQNLFAIITDDAFKTTITELFDLLSDDVKTLGDNFESFKDGLKDGTITVNSATNAKQDGEGNKISTTYLKRNSILKKFTNLSPNTLSTNDYFKGKYYTSNTRPYIGITHPTGKTAADIIGISAVFRTRDFYYYASHPDSPSIIDADVYIDALFTNDTSEGGRYLEKTFENLFNNETPFAGHYPLKLMICIEAYSDYLLFEFYEYKNNQLNWRDIKSIKSLNILYK